MLVLPAIQMMTLQTSDTKHTSFAEATRAKDEALELVFVYSELFVYVDFTEHHFDFFGRNASTEKLFHELLKLLLIHHSVRILVELSEQSHHYERQYAWIRPLSHLSCHSTSNTATVHAKWTLSSRATVSELPVSHLALSCLASS
jgi:hypothetical protein